ncbi:MAG: glycosyltransferase family 2 protein [Planctomycetia bacterium]
MSGSVAVVVNWNGGAGNLACIESLLRGGFAPGDIVFVDNGSRDGSLELVRARHPDLRFLENGANLGFGKASNQGLALAFERGAQSVFFVNNDVEVDRAMLQRLQEELATRPEVGIAGPRILQRADDRRVWSAGGRVDWRQNLSKLLGHGSPDAGPWRTTRTVDYVAGCALLARADLLRRLGGFDDAYFAYMEDVDLCLRARALGQSTVCVGSAVAWHAPSSATGGGYSARRKYMNALNSWRFLRRHANPTQWASFVVHDCLSWPFVLLAGIARGRGRAALAKGLGLWHGLLGRAVDPAYIADGASWLWPSAGERGKA